MSNFLSAHQHVADHAAPVATYSEKITIGTTGPISCDCLRLTGCCYGYVPRGQESEITKMCWNEDSQRRRCDHRINRNIRQSTWRASRCCAFVAGSPSNVQQICNESKWWWSSSLKPRSHHTNWHKLLLFDPVTPSSQRRTVVRYVMRNDYRHGWTKLTRFATADEKAVACHGEKAGNSLNSELGTTCHQRSVLLTDVSVLVLHS